MANPLTTIRSGNPGLNDKTFAGLPRPGRARERQSVQGHQQVLPAADRAAGRSAVALVPIHGQR